MNIKIISPSENMISILGDQLLKTKEIYNNVVVFQGTRPSYFLRKYLALKNGNALRAPFIGGMDAFIDFCFKKLDDKKRTANTMDLIYLLLCSMRKYFAQTIKAELDEIENLDYVLPWAFSVISEMEELKVNMIKPNEIASYNDLITGDIRLRKITERIDKFSLLYDEFYKAVAKSGLITKAQKYAAVAENIENIDLSEYENIIFAGFFRFRKSEEKIASYLLNKNAELLLVRNKLLNDSMRFLHLNITQEDKESEDIRFYKSTDIHGEIFKLAEILNQDKPKDEKNVIVMPEVKALFPLIQNVISDDMDFNISIGCSVKVSALYSLFKGLAELFKQASGSGYNKMGYISVINHPYIKNIACKDTVENGRIIVQNIVEKISENLSKYVALTDVENMSFLNNSKLTEEEFKKHITEIHSFLIRPFESIKNISDFCDKCVNIIDEIQEKGTASKHSYWHAFSEEMIKCFQDLSLSKLGAVELGNTNAYFNFLDYMLNGVSYPFVGTPVKGLQILGPLETRSLNFDTVYYMDANADVLPSHSGGNKILSEFIRRELGLDNSGIHEQEAQYYFENLVRSAKTVHIFYKDSSEDEISPFVAKLIWNREKQGKAFNPDSIYFTPSFSSDSPLKVLKSEKTLSILKNFVFSPTALDSYLRCGLRFYYEYILGIRSGTEASDGLEKQDIGTIVHDILKKFFESKIGKPLSISWEDYSFIDELTENILEETIGSTEKGYELILKKQLINRLHDVLAYHNNELSGITVHKCEFDLRAVIETRFGGVKLKGRADRIDVRGGEAFIVDYKTGNIDKIKPSLRTFSYEKKENWKTNLKSFQLPMYVYILESAGIPGLFYSSVNASLLGLGKVVISESTLFDDKCERKLKQKEMVMAIKDTIEDVLNPDLSFMPTDDANDCAYCPFADSCGRI